MLSQIRDIRRLYLWFLLSVFVVSIAVLVLSLVQGSSGALIISDGKQYYVWLRSLMIDGDINFRNDYQAIYPPDPIPYGTDAQTSTGLVPNKYSIGLALLEVPGFLVGHLIAQTTSFQADGLSLPYQLSVTISLVILVLISCFCLYKSFRNYGLSSQISSLFCTAIVCATNLIHYIAKEPAMPHAASFALSSIVTFILSLEPRSSKRIFHRLLVGILIGWLVIIRASNVVLLPFFLFLLLRREKPSIKSVISYGLGISFMIGLEAIARFSLWGSFLANSYRSEGFTSGAGRLEGILGSLFSANHGLFIYHPWYLVLVLINVLGLRFSRTRNWNLIALISFSSLWLINGSWWGWSFGDSFGSRGFIEVLVPLSVGAAMATKELINASSKRRILLISIVSALAILNFYLWSGYLLKQYPHNGSHTIAEAYLWLRNSN